MVSTFNQYYILKIRGQLINISAIVADQSENPLASTIIRAQFSQDSKGELGERELIQMLPAKCSQYNYIYHVYSSIDNKTIVIYSDDGPCRELGLTFVVHFLPCPLGLELSQRNNSCVCHSPLQ